MFSWLPWVRSHRAELRSRPLPEAWRAIVDEALRGHSLSEEQRRTLDGLIQVFLDDKEFEGLGGLELTDTIRVTIATHACLLLVGLDVDVPYPGLVVIRVYPYDYRTEASVSLGEHRLPVESARQGQSSADSVVLSWPSVRQGIAAPHDGHNLVLHEFAHQLDTQDGRADGAPPLPRQLYGPWARILGEAFEELEEDVAANRRTVLDAYGATNPAEFFAVATETFFEQPRRLKREEPELYAILARYYHQDPASRQAATRPRPPR